MKKLLLFALFLSGMNACFSQSLTGEIPTDPNKNKEKKTVWETFSKSKQIVAYTRASKLNDIVYLDVRLILQGGKVFAVNSGANLIFKMENDSLLTLNIPKYDVSCMGCGAIGAEGSETYGIELNITVGIDKVDALSKHKIKKIKVNTSDWAVESDVKEKFQETIKNALVQLQ